MEKDDGTIKARACVIGSTQRNYISREEAESPTVSTEAVLITGVIEAKQQRDIITADIPNALIQTSINEEKSSDRETMKIRGHLIDILNKISPEIYGEYIAIEGNQRVIFYHEEGIVQHVDFSTSVL